MEPKISIIGAGLAGVEAAYYLANKGYKVKLYEQKPLKKSKAHHSDFFAELVCSNSLKNKNLDNACGLLKKEMEMLNSIMIEAAKASEVPSGNALSVDREVFAKYITQKIKSHPNIEVIAEEVKEFKQGYTIVATGPLTSSDFSQYLQQKLGEDFLFFYDASAPIVTLKSINLNVAYYKSRYDQGDESYLNCPFTKEQFDRFYQELINGKTALIHEFDRVFEGCMPIEVLAKRGEKTLTFGPLKPRGLEKDHERPYAVVQLRQDNVNGDLYNIVGFQTNLTYGEQQRIFRLIPGLEKAEFIRYGLMHRNTFILAPKYLNRHLFLKDYPEVQIAGQLAGVEGYVESAASGLLAAIYLAKQIENKPFEDIPNETMLGSLINYLVLASPKNFSPMNANYGIMHNLLKDRFEVANRSLSKLQEWKDKYGI